MQRHLAISLISHTLWTGWLREDLMLCMLLLVRFYRSTPHWSMDHVNRIRSLFVRRH